MQYIIPLNIIDLQGDGFHPLIDITLFGKSYKLVLDTGASRTALDKTLLAEANGEDFILASDKLSTGLGTNSMVSFTATLSDMHLGELKLDSFDVAVLDLSTINIAYEQLNHPKVLGVLGGDVLMKYKAVIDYGKRQITLKTRKRKS
ncbi:retroviral-like aspartic protease family protein [Mucilaginibacter sp. UR6-1]|uniref:retropepsin-like aspartic protease n=1 Tax=Mucilaginibacter sp. UR6-1 TaxID=1435643 RepID=UPI001E473D09|nr:retropepsin-like aspartic protease [Mucilaginibacter sp. UR6-1]MCC8408882.1 retroviral-like aspartic protease family protein [Mucilaginibacter sp. UR6-1]